MCTPSLARYDARFNKPLVGTLPYYADGGGNYVKHNADSTTETIFRGNSSTVYDWDYAAQATIVNNQDITCEAFAAGAPDEGAEASQVPPGMSYLVPKVDRATKVWITAGEGSLSIGSDPATPIGAGTVLTIGPLGVATLRAKAGGLEISTKAA